MKGQNAGPREAGDRHPLVGDQQVRRWRREQLLAMGFSLSASRALAESRAELGAVRALLAHGCPHETVRRIVI